MSFSIDRSRVLVSTAWLAGNLDNPTVRIIDCRYYFEGPSGREVYAESHIPGAVYLDWVADLSDPNHPVDYMMPPAEQVAAVMSRLGVGTTRSSWPTMTRADTTPRASGSSWLGTAKRDRCASSMVAGRAG